MEGRVHMSLLICIGILVACLSAQTAVTEDSDKTNRVLEVATLEPSFEYEPEARDDSTYIQRFFNRTVAKLPNLSKLITDNAAFVRLMSKAKKSVKLELRLLEWAELVNQMAEIDEQLTMYVGKADELEDTTLEDYLNWCVSHDPGAINGILKKIKSLILPIFKSQGLLQLVFNFLGGDKSNETKSMKIDPADLEL